MSARFGFVAVSTNPAIDRVVRLDGEATGIVHAAELLETPGGKAIHCARVAAELGAGVSLITPAGGRNGDLLLETLGPEPLDIEHVSVAAPTRGTYTLVAGSGGELVEVHEPGGALTEAECDDMVSRLAGIGTAPSIVAVCGSLPPGAPTDLHARLIATARELGAFTILDCSTPAALAAGIAAGPDLAAPNLGEAGALLGIEPGTRPADPELATIVDAIRERGAAAVWLSLGPEGSVLAGAQTSVRLSAPAPERIVNAVGCGDALIGGFAAGLLRGDDARSAAALGVAAAGQKLANLDPGRVERAAVEAIVPTVEATPFQPQVAVR